MTYALTVKSRRQLAKAINVRSQESRMPAHAPRQCRPFLAGRENLDETCPSPELAARYGVTGKVANHVLFIRGLKTPPAGMITRRSDG
jgi:hypothetical protein